VTDVRNMQMLPAMKPCQHSLRPRWIVRGILLLMPLWLAACATDAPVRVAPPSSPDSPRPEPVVQPPSVTVKRLQAEARALMPLVSTRLANDFLSETRNYVGIDDHVIVNEGTGIPVADVIAWDPTTSAFPSTWHTHADNMTGIDKGSLLAVGATMMLVVWGEQ
jgi:hypothetical protein